MTTEHFDNSEDFNYENRRKKMGVDFENAGSSKGKRAGKKFESKGKSVGKSHSGKRSGGGSHHHHYNRTGLIVGLSVAGAVILFIILYFSLRKTK